VPGSRLVITGNLAGSNPRLWSDYTQTGKLLRHSKFAGLCEDKEARTVGKEQAGES
jgi:hypothetical protein